MQISVKTAGMTTPPTLIVIIVYLSLPEACSPAFSISSMHTKKAAAPMMASSPAPARWLPG